MFAYEGRLLWQSVLCEIFNFISFCGHMANLEEALLILYEFPLRKICFPDDKVAVGCDH